eukprot:jgi/Galph1/1510/GphlegSOOS_G198.1
MDTWRDYFVKSVELKFNCYFLMPIMEDFAYYMRQETEKLYQNDSLFHEIFDVAAIRSSLIKRKEELLRERRRVEHLQEKFHAIHLQLSSFQPREHHLLASSSYTGLPASFSKCKTSQANLKQKNVRKH